MNLAVRIGMYLHNEFDICMYLSKNTAIYLHFFNVRICKYVSICMYRMYLHDMHVYVCMNVLVSIICICMYCLCIQRLVY